VRSKPRHLDDHASFFLYMLDFQVKLRLFLSSNHATFPNLTTLVKYATIRV
jgi:hypothetical protein